LPAVEAALAGLRGFAEAAKLDLAIVNLAIVNQAQFSDGNLTLETWEQADGNLH